MNDGVTFQSGSDLDVRGTFVRDGKLAGSKDGNFRAINDNWPVFGYAVDFASVGVVSVSQLFTIGLCQEKAAQFLGANGLVTLPSLWKDYFRDDLAAVSILEELGDIFQLTFTSFLSLIKTTMSQANYRSSLTNKSGKILSRQPERIMLF